MRVNGLWAAGRRAAALCLVVALSACSSGSDDQRPLWAQQAYPAVSEDSNPAVARTDYRSQNLFAAGAGDTWTFENSQGATLVRTVTRVDADTFTLTDKQGASTLERSYRRTSNGLVLLNPLPTAPAGAQRQIGDMLWYPEPFYAVGAKRTMVRQGNWGADVDGDLANESFRYVVEQEFLGFEAVSTPLGQVQAARFRTTSILSLVPSNPDKPTKVELSTEETWWASGLGMVRMAVTTRPPGAANASTSIYSLVSGTVGGVALAPPPVLPTAAAIDGSLIKMDLAHQALVYDAKQARYYAAVAATALVNSNRLAIIDAKTGQVSYSEVVGDDPSTLALSVDGSYLFVGLRASGELRKYSVPDLQLQSVVVLPRGANGEMQYAQALAASPVNPTYVAVSLAQAGSQAGAKPSHQGVLMNLTGQFTDATLLGNYAHDAMAFDASGDVLYGLQRDGTALGLSRAAWSYPGSLQFVDAVATGGALGARTLEVTPQGLWLGHALYRASDLSLVGRANVSGGACRAMATPARVVCLDSDRTQAGSGRLAVVDATTLATKASPKYALSGLASQPVEVVPGPATQVALRFAPALQADATSSLWLFTSKDLQ